MMRKSKRNFKSNLVSRSQLFYLGLSAEEKINIPYQLSNKTTSQLITYTPCLSVPLRVPRAFVVPTPAPPAPALQPSFPFRGRGHAGPLSTTPHTHPSAFFGIAG